MTALPLSSFPRPTGRDWLDQLFRARSARTGGVVRPDISDVEREIGLIALEVEVRRRGFHMLIAGLHVVILCAPSPFTIIC
ncbi:N-(5'-phosphoribosyl)anthranilate isomerase [Pelagimonas sp. KU-00592-HH]|uniref:N-(5'-phosphoribosyl)anthranilate isomerase n=1 Tax=Pelagimonas sp. KU-00592-HH TaxID=3127651 RepID=UPI00333FDEEA